MLACNQEYIIRVFTVLLLASVYVHGGSKCKDGNFSSDLIEYPKVQVTKLIPITTARKFIENEKPLSNNTFKGDNKHIMIPTMLDTFTLQCSAEYRVQWGFESYPWITFDTFTGASPPLGQHESKLYTATIEFHKVQETSLQTRIPICYSARDPCIQTAVEPRSGPSNKVEITLVAGSKYEIQSKSEKELFGTNKNCTLQFGYDPKSQKFYCRETDPSKPQTSGKIFLRPCPDPVTCNSLLADSNCPVEEMPPIEMCSVKNRCRTETAFAGKFPGIAVCHAGNALEHSAAIPYFFALQNLDLSQNKTKRYINWDDADPSEMLKLQKFDTYVYTKQKMSIVCNASYFYLGSGMYFTLFKQDSPSASNDEVASIETGKEELDEIKEAIQAERNQLESGKERIIYEDANIGGVSSKLPLIRTLEVSEFVFEASGRYSLACHAPLWNTTEWAHTSTIIMVKESIPPGFDGGNMTVKQYFAPNRRLECIAFGMPKPELTWTRDGGSIPSEISLVTGEQNQTWVWAILTFPKSEKFFGNFSCRASNVAGENIKTFIIIPADKTSSTAMWVLIGLSIMVTIFIPLILYLTWKVRRQRRFIDDLTQEEVDEFINGRPEYIPFHCDMSTYAYYLPYDTKFEIPRDSLEIDLKRVLGSGEYGLVLYGLYKNANPPDGGAPYVKPVAIKTTKPLANGKTYFKALLSELKIMTYIGTHGNIVNLIGACTQNIKKREVFIATEYCENGSLLAFLRTNRYACENPLFYAELMHSRRTSTLSAETSFMNPLGVGLILGEGIINKSDTPDIQYVKMEDLGNIVVNPHYENIRSIKLQDLMQWCLDIALGMEFLTSKKVIHGDLAARNVLLTRDMRCKIGDFGLSRQLFHYDHYTKTALTPLPLKWLAIECLQNFQFSIESDVWAFGITCFEIWSIGEIPYSSVQMNGEEFLRALKHGMRLSKPAYAPTDVFDLMMKCWKHDRKQRPSFQTIVQFFQSRLSKNA